MSTQQEKLKAIADAIREKEGTTEPIAANDFPERIRAIQSGESVPEPTVEERLYPYAVYRATRPADWPQMWEPQENDICLYVRRDQEGVEEAPNKSLFAMTLGGSGTISIKYLHNPIGYENGVPNESQDWDGEKIVIPCESGHSYGLGNGANEFAESDNMIRIHFEGTIEVLKLSESATDPSGENRGICEIWCNLPSNISFAMGKDSSHCYTTNLRYFKQTGTITRSTNFAFSKCQKLIAVLEYPNIEAVSFGLSAFNGCSNLEAIPPIIWKGIAGRKNNMTNVFMGAIKLKHCPIYGYKLHALTNSRTFNDCSNLQSIPQWILDETTSTSSSFLEGCTGIKELRLHRNPSFPSDTFSELEILTFNPDSPISSSLTVNIPKMGYLNFKTMLLSLPQNTSSTDINKSLTITLSEETKAQVTDDDYAICTEKGWILTIT